MSDFLNQNVYATAAVWMTLATLGAFLALRLKLAAALVEIILGMLAGNLIALRTNTWIDFIAGFGSIMLTFLAGAEIDPKVLREQARPAGLIGAISFFAPFLAAWAYAWFGLHWDPNASKIAGIAMSTTSVAVVYAVMLETGLASRKFGQLILAGCFVTDLGTVVALGLMFANVNAWLFALVAVIPISMFVVPRILPGIFAAIEGKVSEPGLRLVYAIILALSGLATIARSEGVLPAYFLGLACAGFLFSHRDVARRLRALTLSFLTPFYFIKAGTFVSFAQAIAGIWVIVAFFCVKVAAKIIGVWPMTRAFRYTPRDTSYLTLMMATGLTFGTISSLYGLQHGYITQSQYTALVTVVILTALIPTLIAQTLFHPHEQLAADPELEEESVGVP